MILKPYRQLANLAYQKHEPLRRKKADKTMRFKRSKGFNLDYAANSIPISNLVSCLERAGFKRADTVFLRISLPAAMAFEGGVVAFLKTLKEFFADGNLVMSSYTFNKSPLMFLADNPVFDPQTSIDQLSLVNEFFRRTPGTVRSIHPTHSVSACGKDAEWITKDHHRSDFCYGPDSPFARLYELEAKEISIGVYPTSITFHYIEQFVPVDAPGYRDFDIPIMCRMMIDGQETFLPFKVTSQFARYIQDRSVFLGTAAQSRHFTFGSGLDFTTVELMPQLAAMKKLIAAGKHWHYTQSRLKNFALHNVVRPLVLAAFFENKDGCLYPVKESCKS